jgi:hypothetical protein
MNQSPPISCFYVKLRKQSETQYVSRRFKVQYTSKHIRVNDACSRPSQLRNTLDHDPMMYRTPAQLS